MHNHQVLHGPSCGARMATQVKLHVGGTPARWHAAHGTPPRGSGPASHLRLWTQYPGRKACTGGLMAAAAGGPAGDGDIRSGQSTAGLQPDGRASTADAPGSNGNRDTSSLLPAGLVNRLMSLASWYLSTSEETPPPQQAVPQGCAPGPIAPATHTAGKVYNWSRMPRDGVLSSKPRPKHTGTHKGPHGKGQLHHHAAAHRGGKQHSGQAPGPGPARSSRDLAQLLLTPPPCASLEPGSEGLLQQSSWASPPAACDLPTTQHAPPQAHEHQHQHQHHPNHQQERPHHHNHHDAQHPQQQQQRHQAHAAHSPSPHPPSGQPAQGAAHFRPSREASAALHALGLLDSHQLHGTIGLIDGHVAAQLGARPRTKPYRHLVFGGGGARCIAYIGAVTALRHSGSLQELRSIAGASGGAIFAILTAVGVELEEVLAFLEQLPSREPLNLVQLRQRLGLSDGSTIFGPISKAVARKIGVQQPTLGDVQRYSGIEVVICATSLTRRAPLYISSASHPDISVMDALRMSCAIPLYFTPVVLGGEVLVDGCLTDCAPVRGLGPVDLRHVLVLDVNDDTQPGDDLQGLLGALLATCFQAGFHLLGSEVDVLDLGPACQGLGALQFKMGRGTAESVIAAAADSTLQFLAEHSDGGAMRRQA